MVTNRKFQKRESCLYCEEQMESKYRNKRFCSDKCRVYWNRENVKREVKPQAPVEIEKEEINHTHVKLNYINRLKKHKKKKIII